MTILADSYDAFLLDLDGVVWRGESAIDGAEEAIRALRDRGKRVVFVTNNSSRTNREYAIKLMRMKIPTSTQDIVTSGHAVVAELKRMGLGEGDRVHACCADGLARLLSHERFVPTRETTDVKAVVVGWFPKGTFEDIARASTLARAGVPLIASNDDATYPTEDGLLPGTGALVAAITMAAGTEALVVGKPRPALFRLALQAAGIEDPARALFCGDRPETDVVGARAAGIPCALMLTGVTSEGDLARLDTTPDIICDGLADLLRDVPYPTLERRDGALVAVDGRDLATLTFRRRGKRAVLQDLAAGADFDRRTWWRLVRRMLVEAIAGAEEVEASPAFAPYLERLGVGRDGQLPLFVS